MFSLSLSLSLWDAVSVSFISSLIANMIVILTIYIDPTNTEPILRVRLTIYGTLAGKENAPARTREMFSFSLSLFPRVYSLPLSVIIVNLLHRQ